MENRATTEQVTDHIKGIYDILSSKAAPAQVGKPVFEKDLELAKAHGARTLAHVFGARDENQAISSINFGRKSQTAFMPEETRQRLFNLKRMFSDMEIQANYMFRTSNPTVDQMKATPIFRDYFEAAAKAFNITDFSNWIPQAQARFYFDEYTLPYILADEFDTQPMDSATLYVPGILGQLEGKEEGDDATFTEQSNTQSGFTVYARSNVVHTKITEDLQADSAPAIIDKLRREVLAGNARAYERALINGDTTGSPRGASHMDSDIAAASKHFSKAFKGLRKKAFDNTANGVVYDHGGDSPSKALFAELLKRMGNMSSEKSDLLWVLGSSLSTDLVTGAIPELFTAFAFGSTASNVTGAVPPVFGVRGVESQYIREDLNASGVYEAAQTKTCLLLVKKSRFMNFLRSGLKVWAAPSLPSSDLMLMSSKIRHSFEGNPQGALEKAVTMGINIATR